MAQLIGSGRSAGVYEHDPGWVLRRYREPHDTEREAAAMRHARANGFPCPQARALSETEIVMERLDGPTMLEDLGRRPWLVGRHAATLAALHGRLHAIAAPDSLPEPLGSGSDLLHLDLHPANVVLTADGPSVIDWSSVARGPGLADVAYTWVILATAEAPNADLRERLTVAGRKVFMRLFLRRFGRAEREAVRRLVPRAAATRLQDRNLPPEELPRVRRLTTR